MTVWVLVVPYDDRHCWDDGVGFVHGPFGTKAEAESYGAAHYPGSEAFELLAPVASG